MFLPAPLHCVEQWQNLVDQHRSEFLQSLPWLHSYWTGLMEQQMSSPEVKQCRCWVSRRMSMLESTVASLSRLLPTYLSHDTIFITKLAVGTEVVMAYTNLEQTVCVRWCARRRVNRIHPCELLRKVPHIKFTLEFWFEWARYLFLRKVCPVQTLFKE